MFRIIRTTALLAVTAVAANAQRVEGRNESAWSTRLEMDRGDKLKLNSPNGSITITEGRGSELVVRAEKKAERGARMDDIGFVVRKVDDGVVICAVYNDDDDCLADGESGRRNSYRNWSDRNHASASFTVQLPAGVRIKASTGNGVIAINGAGSDVDATTGNGRVLVSNTSGRVTATTGNGDITVEGARGNVNARTGNGDVIVATSSGAVNASTGSGDISVSMARLEQASAMRFATGSGDVNLAVPSRFGAELDATTGSGEITTEIPIRLVGRANRYRLRATLGDGGERLAISTGSGRITIREAR